MTTVRPTTMIASRRVGNRKMSRAEALSVEMVPPVMILVVRSSDHKTSCVHGPIPRVIGSKIAVVGTFVRSAYVVIACASGQQQGRRRNSADQKFSCCLHRSHLAVSPKFAALLLSDLEIRLTVELLLLLRRKLTIVNPNSVTSDQVPVVNVEPVGNFVRIN
jgi:hypothetical protein